MDKNMVVVESGEPVVSTEILAEGFGVSHRAVLATIKKHEIHFSESRQMVAHATINRQGKPTRFYLLDEEQSAFLGTLLKNTPQVVGFKRKLTKEFFRIRRALNAIASQKQNAEWLEKRDSGKLIRRQETDGIKAFVEYATAQGSKHADKYYANITTMENRSLFLLEQKYPNIRNILSLHQLSAIECADKIVARALAEGMERQMPYKEVFQLAKARVESFAEIHGKTAVPVPQMAWKPQQQMIEEAIL